MCDAGDDDSDGRSLYTLGLFGCLFCLDHIT